MLSKEITKPLKTYKKKLLEVSKQEMFIDIEGGRLLKDSDQGYKNIKNGSHPLFWNYMLKKKKVN